MRRVEGLSKTLKKLYGCTGLPVNTDRCTHKQLSVKSTNVVKAWQLITTKPPHDIAELSTKVTHVPQRDEEQCYFTGRELLATCRNPSNCGLGLPSGEMLTRNSTLQKCI